MLGLLCVSQNVGWIVAAIILIVLMVIYLAYGMASQKKQRDQTQKMLSELKKGDKIVTHYGIYGEIVLQKETNMGRIVVIRTGDEAGKPSFMTINAAAIAGIDTKKDLILDAQGNVIEPEEAKKKVLVPEEKKLAEGKVENSAPKDEVKPEEKKEKKVTPKKKPTKKVVQTHKTKTAKAG